MMVLKRVVARFLDVLDSEGVVFFQVLVYLHLAAGGAYCALVANGVPDTMINALGPAFDRAWQWLCVGALICLLGKVLAMRAMRSHVWAYSAGLYLQLAGDVSATGAFAGYVVSTIQVSQWGKALIGVWVFASLAQCAFFLCWRDIRRIAQAERAVRR